MRRGEIRIADLEPVRGSEATKRRPAVIVSNDGANLAAARDRGLDERDPDRECDSVALTDEAHRMVYDE